MRVFFLVEVMEPIKPEPIMNKWMFELSVGRIEVLGAYQRFILKTVIIIYGIINNLKFFGIIAGIVVVS